MPRTTIEIHPAIHKAIKLVALRKRIKVKYVANSLLRYSLMRVDAVFPEKRFPG
jgi:hypothetical protein